MPVTVVNSKSANIREHGVLHMEKPARKIHQPRKRIVIGLLNNMSASALDATERQFVDLLESASDGISIEVKRFVLPEILAGEATSIYRDRNYQSTQSLQDAQIDGLIVTGREPITPDLRHEAYWGSFVRVLEWAQNETISTIWSCLAAHAAALHMDGIQRVRSEQKHSGVFACTRVSDHAIAAGVPVKLRFPHSRWNGLREADLVQSGYEVVTRMENGEVDCFLKQGNSLFVFFQGHPEYQAETLLLEYRRDVGRFLRGETKNYPCIPHGCFDQSVAVELSNIQKQAMEQGGKDALAQIASIGSTVDKRNGWNSAASQFYRNWLEYIYARKKSRSDAREKAVARASGNREETLQSMQG